MSEVNFCPFCDAPQHKILACKEDVFFCKTCNKFFNLKHLEVNCPKCKGSDFEKSDFPTPDGQAVFHCRKCSKTYSASEFLSNIK
jgi:Zn finger protein HypA/HybF involved in hydrogenase expression